MPSSKKLSRVSFQGSMVALITPMFPDGSLDFESYRKLIDWHILEKTDALVIVGTTGESATVELEEHIELIKIAVRQSADQIPIIVGIGSNSTKKSIKLANHALQLGADACLAVTPYYNKPTQEGLYQHFRSIAESVELPLIIYNVPGRTGIDISIETLLMLSSIPNIVGIKDATGDIGKGILLLKKIELSNKEFEVYSGDDSTAAALMLFGAKANISVTANLFPRIVHDLCMAALKKDVLLVNQLNSKLVLLNNALFLESNPIPVKWALSHLKNTPLGYRLPLSILNPIHHKKILSAIQELE